MNVKRATGQAPSGSFLIPQTCQREPSPVAQNVPMRTVPSGTNVPMRTVPSGTSGTKKRASENRPRWHVWFLFDYVDPALRCFNAAHLDTGEGIIQLLGDGAHLLHAAGQADLLAMVNDLTNG